MSILGSRVPPPRSLARPPKRYQRPRAPPTGFYGVRRPQSRVGREVYPGPHGRPAAARSPRIHLESPLRNPRRRRRRTRGRPDRLPLSHEHSTATRIGPPRRRFLTPPLRTWTPVIVVGQNRVPVERFRPFHRDTANGGETEPLPGADIVRIMRNRTNCADRLGSPAADRLPQALDRPA